MKPRSPTDDSTEEEQLLFALADRPAYLRRADAVEAERRRLFRKLAADRVQLLFRVRLALKTWNRTLVDHPALSERMSPFAAETLARLNDAVFVAGESTATPTSVGWAMWAPRRWRRLRAAVGDFNAKWRAQLALADASALDRAIESYNRHYVFEKECALRSARLAVLGFAPLPAMTPETLAAEFPPLDELPERFDR
jgi:hypothetical protein